MTVLMQPRLESAEGALPRQVADRVCTWAEQAFGLVFVATLIIGTAYFPWMKGMPLGYVPIIVGALLAVLLLHPSIGRMLHRLIMSPSSARFMFGLIVVAIVVRAVPAIAWGLPPVSDHSVYHGRAVQMLNGEGYGPTAFFAPGMSFWLLGIYSVIGPTFKGALVVNGLIGGAFAGLTLAVARRIVAEPAARFAGVLAAVFPSLVVCRALTLSNDPLIGVLLFAAVYLFLRTDHRSQGWRYVLLVGVVLGMLSFVKPIGLLVPFVLGVAYWRHGVSVRRSMGNALVMLLGVFIVLSPWIARNYRLFDAFVPVTTSAGAALWMTNHDGATPMTERIPEFPPGTSEVEINRVLWQDSWAYIGGHPQEFVSMLLPKFAYQWGTSSSIMATVSYDRWNSKIEAATKGMINVGWGMLVVLFSVSVLRGGFCKSPRRFWPVLALLAYLWGVHLFFEPQSRYHLPLLPAMFIPAAVAVMRNCHPVGQSD